MRFFLYLSVPIKREKRGWRLELFDVVLGAFMVGYWGFLDFEVRIFYSLRLFGQIFKIFYWIKI